MKRIVRSKPVWIAAAVVLLVGAGLVWHHKTSPYHFNEVAEAVLYRSGTLRPHNLEKVLDEYGIRTVLNVRSEKENGDAWHAQEARICRARNVRLVDMPLAYGTPPTPEQISRFLELVRDEQKSPVLVHCEHGVVRTGMIVAVYEMEQRRKGNEKTLEELRMFGHDLGRHPKMRKFILGYRPRWK